MGVCHSRRPGHPKPALDVHIVPAPGTAEAPEASEALEPGLKEEAAGGVSPKRPTFFMAIYGYPYATCMEYIYLHLPEN